MLCVLKNQIAVIRARLNREEGQDMVEYALILGLISIIAVLAVTNTGQAVQTIWEAVESAMPAS